MKQTPSLSVRTYPTAHEAERVAALLRSGDDEWTYRVECPDGGAFVIAVYEGDDLLGFF